MTDISVVIPAFNPQMVDLERCIDSVLRGASLSLQVIVVDDGSQAGCAEAWRMAESKGAAVKVVHQVNSGVSAARNKGLSLSEGRYVTFVDSDDAVADGWLDTACAKAEESGADIVYGRVLMCSGLECEAMRRTPTVQAATWLEFGRTSHDVVRGELMKDRSRLLPGLDHLDHGPCAKLFRRSVLEGVAFPPGIRYSEDQVFNHLALGKSGLCLVTDMLAYYYISNGRSATHSAVHGIVEDMMESLRLIRATIPDMEAVRGAFALRTLFDAWMGFGMEFFRPDAIRTTLREKISFWRRLRSTPLMRDALACPVSKTGDGFGTRVKFFVLKRFPVASVVCKALKSRFWGCR